MAISNNHKLALLYIMRELLLRTDENHTLNAPQLIKILKTYGCEADRRTIYNNIDILKDFGLDIIQVEKTPGGYFIGSREFELPELKLLVDAVQSSKFITEKKSEQLIKKLMTLTNENRARELNREVYIQNRTKADNEKIFYNVDALHEAMNSDVQVEFQYGEWNLKKRLVSRKEGKIYRASPWALTWDDENYYLIAYDEDDEMIKHFRVDKMMKILVSDVTRNGKNEFKGFDLPSFSRKTFGMFSGTEANVTLRCENSLVGVVIDRFGKGVMIVPEGKSRFTVRVDVDVSQQFFGWVTAIGEGMEIKSPPKVRAAYKEYIQNVLKKY